MMGVTHMLIGSAGVSLIFQTADARMIAIGAIASLLPDVDTSTSPAGHVFPWFSRWLERRFPHRSCTHSLVASGIVAALSYPAAIAGYVPVELVNALNLGFFFGYFADAFTASGCELFWPSNVRAVWPGNRKFRLRTNSPVEYGILVVFAFAMFASININANGGIMSQFNRLIASPTGVEQLYNEKGSNHLMIAHIKGVRASDRAPINGDFLIIQAHGQGFVVQSADGAIYKTGTEADVQIIPEKITADAGPPAVVNVEAVPLSDQEVNEALMPFNRPDALVFISGQLTIDDPVEIHERIRADPHQFPFIRATGVSIILEYAPLSLVWQTLADQTGTGYLFVRTLYAQPQASPSIGSKS